MAVGSGVGCWPKVAGCEEVADGVDLGQAKNFQKAWRRNAVEWAAGRRRATDRITHQADLGNSAPPLSWAPEKFHITSLRICLTGLMLAEDKGHRLGNGMRQLPMGGAVRSRALQTWLAPNQLCRQIWDGRLFSPGPATARGQQASRMPAGVQIRFGVLDLPAGISSLRCLRHLLCPHTSQMRAGSAIADSTSTMSPHSRKSSGVKEMKEPAGGHEWADKDRQYVVPSIPPARVPRWRWISTLFADPESVRECLHQSG
jgi:hypothetical protein